VANFATVDFVFLEITLEKNYFKFRIEVGLHRDPLKSQLGFVCNFAKYRTDGF